MKKKIGVLIFSCLLAFLFISCDEVLSVVTSNEDGKKNVNNYVLMWQDTVYDETASFNSWKDITLLEEDNLDSIVNSDEILFKIENKKDKLVVFGDKKSAVEITFIEGGYTFKLFASQEQMNKMFDF